MARKAELGPVAAADARREKLEALQRRLTDQVASLRSGPDWARMLSFASHFHRYSATNTMLIAQQYENLRERGLVTAPRPTYVAGFNTWRALGRTVDRGQIGLAIMAPSVHRPRTVELSDGTLRELATGERVSAGETLHRDAPQVRGFRVEHIFAVEQTSGKPIPSVPRPQPLQGHAPAGLISGLRAFAEAEGFGVLMVASKDDLGGADGVTKFLDRTISVRTDMSDAAIASTLAHEVGHVLLHDLRTHDQPPAMHRGIGEVEAESVAYIVAAAHGLDTSSDSLPYVAGWLGTRVDIRDVQATANRVVGAAHRVLTSLPTVQHSDGQPPGLHEALRIHEPAITERDLSHATGPEL